MSAQERTNSTPPTWILIRSEDEQHWWVDEQEEESPVLDAGEMLGVLSPSQVREITETLDGYSADGYRRTLFDSAFFPMRADRRLSDGRLRLVPAGKSFFEGREEVFALPNVPSMFGDEKGFRGSYPYFLDKLEQLRVKRLNRTHHYARDVDEIEMEEELRLADSDRYFCGAAVHVYDEISEILFWSPEEWDEGS